MVKENNIILKYINGNCSEKEANEVLEWLKGSSYRPDLFRELERFWYKESFLKDAPVTNKNLETTLDRIHHRINIFKEEEDSKTRYLRNLKTILYRIAAILILPLLIINLLFINKHLEHKDQFIEVKAIAGCRIQHNLPDGSTVWLNSGSTLTYPGSFTKRNRQVELIGEAYFDVVRDSKHPLRVKTESVDITVTGTSFNIMAYESENVVSATLEKGNILVGIPDKSRNRSRYLTLTPGDHVVINKGTGNFRRTNTDTYKYTSWKDGRLVFRNDQLSEIIKRLERWYNTEIEIMDDEELPLTPYTITIEDETITQVLEYLSVASPITWDYIPSYKNKNGNLVKKKYIISSSY